MAPIAPDIHAVRFSRLHEVCYVMNLVGRLEGIYYEFSHVLDKADRSDTASAECRIPMERT